MPDGKTPTVETADAQRLLPAILAMHDAIRDAVTQACERQAVEALSTVADDDEGDTIYAIDKVSEQVLVEHLERIANTIPLILIAEGLPQEGLTLPRGTSANDALFRVLVDPIDGTRGLMFQKRSAWILTGVAPNRGSDTSLNDITLAVQTEIPLVKQHLVDQLWTVRGQSVEAMRFNRLTGETHPLHLKPSTAPGIEHGCVSFVRFFPGARDVLAALDEQVTHAVLGDAPEGKALCFEDQYASTGGQLYELMAGHDRLIADLRPLTTPTLLARGRSRALCCHPYDLSALLIAEQLGVIVTDPRGQRLDAPLNLEADVAWVGYANEAIRRDVEPALQAALRDMKLL